MKRKIILSLSLSFLMSLTSFPVEAIEDKNSAYNLTYEFEAWKDETICRITGVSDHSVKELFIPAQIDGLDVVCTENVFFECSELEKITVDEQSKYMLSEDGVLFISGFRTDGYELVAYPRGKIDTEYTIPKGTYLLNSEYAFRMCMNLKTVNLPDQEALNSVPCLFTLCYNLEEINGTMQTISAPIYGPQKLNKMSLGGQIYAIDLSDYTNLKHLTI